MKLPWGKPKFCVSTLLVALDARQALGLASALGAAQAAILEADGAFEATQQEATRAVGLLLEHQGAWHAAALDTATFKSEEEAGDHGANSFAQLSARYEDLPALEEPRWLVVGVTVGLAGTDPVLERPVNSLDGVRDALAGMMAVRHRGQAALWHLHVAPLPDDDEALLMRFPELVDL